MFYVRSFGYALFYFRDVYPNMTNDTNCLKWKENYDRAKEYYIIQENSYCPVSYRCDDGFRLGEWFARQRKFYKSGKLSNEKIYLLESIGMIWDANAFSKGTSIPELIIYYYIHKYFPDTIKLTNGDFLKVEIDIYIPSLKVGIEYDGVYWHRTKSKIEKDERKGIICKNNGVRLIRIREKGLPKIENCDINYFVRPDNKEELQFTIELILSNLLHKSIECNVSKDYKNIVSGKKDIANYKWNYVYSILEKRYKTKGIDIIKRGEIDASGVNLYNWLCTQRALYKKGLITDYHKEKLEALGIELNPNESEWNLYYKELIKYKEVNGNANVSIEFVASNGKALGRWVAHQRERYRNGKLNSKREKKLADLGLQFNPIKNDEDFKKSLLLKYYKENGNIVIPRDFTFDGVNLFEYVQGIKKKYVKDKLSKSEIEFFNKLGMIWNKYNYQWDVMYEEAKAFYKQNGHLIIPTNYITNTGLNLGLWISTQRCDYKENKISNNKMNKLNDIEMCWNVYDYRWKENYFLLKKYYNEFGNINIKSDFEYCGKKLGMWLNTQRQAYRGNNNYSITQERIDLLNELGVIWKYK